MRQITLVRTRYLYDSYRYYWRLIELAGFPTCFVDEINFESDHVYIVSPMNGEYLPHIQNLIHKNAGKPRNCVLIWWNLERPGNEGTSDASQAPAMWKQALAWATPELVDKIWVCDRHFVPMEPRTKHVMIGSDTRLREGEAIRPFHFDVTHFMYLNHRRGPILEAIRRQGLRVAPDAWDGGRGLSWNSSKFLINIHQNAVLGGEQIRFAVAAAYKMPVLSETMGDPWPLVAGTDYIDIPYSNLVKKAEMYRDKRGGHDLSHIGQALYRKLCLEHPFDKNIRQGVAETLSELKK